MTVQTPSDIGSLLVFSGEGGGPRLISGYELCGVFGSGSRSVGRLTRINGCEERYVAAPQSRRRIAWIDSVVTDVVARGAERLWANLVEHSMCHLAV